MSIRVTIDRLVIDDTLTCRSRAHRLPDSIRLHLARMLADSASIPPSPGDPGRKTPDAHADSFQHFHQTIARAVQNSLER